jgi:hypothetical protein
MKAPHHNTGEAQACSTSGRYMLELPRKKPSRMGTLGTVSQVGRLGHTISCQPFEGLAPQIG